MPEPRPPSPHNIAERAVEQFIFSSRWLLAPVYAGLVVALIVVLVKFGQKTVALTAHALEASVDDMIVGVLGLVDLALVGGLLVIVMFAGYENFVSRLDFDDHKDKPDWMGHVDFADLKLKLMASIVAISAIHLLESFMNVAHSSDRELAWSVGIHLVFVVSGLLLAVTDRVSGKTHG